MPSANHPIRSTPGESLPKGQTVSADQSLKNKKIKKSRISFYSLGKGVGTCAYVCISVRTRAQVEDSPILLRFDVFYVLVRTFNLSLVISETAPSDSIKTFRDVVKSSLVKHHDGDEGLLFGRRCVFCFFSVCACTLSSKQQQGSCYRTKEASRGNPAKAAGDIIIARR